HLELRGIAGFPHHLAAVGIDRAHDLFVFLARERVNAVADDDRRRVARAHFDLPLLRELFGPRPRRRERRHRAIAVRAAPLRPVAAGALSADDVSQSRNGDEYGHRRNSHYHDDLILTSRRLMKILDLEDHMGITSAVSVVAGVVLGIVASAAVQGDAAPQQSAGRRRVIRPEKAPNTGLPFSPGILVGDTLYVSGHLGRDPVTSALVPGGIEPETRQALAN